MSDKVNWVVEIEIVNVVEKHIMHFQCTKSMFLNMDFCLLLK